MSAGDFSAGPSNASGQRAHARLIREILLDLGSEADLALHVNPVGEADLPSVSKDGSYTERHATIGLGPGSPDIVGWLSVPGRPAVVFCLEAKTGAGELNPRQRAWHEEHRRRGVLVFVVRSVADARRALADARRAIGGGRAA